MEGRGAADEEAVYSPRANTTENLDPHRHVMKPPMMDGLRMFLPFAVQQHNFWLKYSMIRDGASMRTLLHKVQSSPRTVLAIETMDGSVFGAFTSSTWRPHGPGFYGSCEAFLWRMSKSSSYRSKEGRMSKRISPGNNIEVFPWSGKNRNIQAMAHAEGQLVVGGGAPDYKTTSDSGEAGCGLVIRPDMVHGFSSPCFTFFDCPGLFTVNGKENNDMFKISNLEVWALTAAEDVQVAKRLESGRRFVFDQGNFEEE